LRERINNQIRSREVRVLDAENTNLGVMNTDDALKLAQEKGLDLIEISPGTKPPVAKIIDYGKFQYDKKKKDKEIKAGSKRTETKSLQVKIGTGDDILELRAKKVSAWLKEGHRVKIELYLVGRSKYKDDEFKKERLDRILKLISEEYKIAEPYKKSPKGLAVTLERAKKK